MATHLFYLDQARGHEFRLWQAALKLRHDVLIGQFGWDLHQRRGAEFDEYDNPHALHICHADTAGRVVGYCRLNPMTFPHLLRDHFSHLFPFDCAIPERSYESTRAVLWPGLRGPERTQVLASMMSGAMAHMAETVGMERIYFVTERALVDHLLVPFELDVQFIDPIGDPGSLVAGYYRASLDQASRIAERYDITLSDHIEKDAACAI